MDLGLPRRLFHLFAAGVRIAIGDVVIDRVVEKDGILRHHADGLMQTGLRHIADILPVDADGAFLDVIEPEQQPPDGRFARPRRPDQRNPLPRPNLDRDTLQDLAVRLIGKFDILEHNLARRHLQRRSIGLVGDLGWLAQKAEHLAHVDQSLSDFAVNRAQKAQRQRDLHHIGVDHDEIANGELTLLHADRRHDHDPDQPGGDDHVLPDVQYRQRLPGAHGKTLIGRHRPVIARRFTTLGVEIFHGFIVQQAVDRLLVCIGILIVHLPADRDPPFGDLERIGHIDRNRGQHDDHILPAEIKREDHRDHGQFQDQRPDRKQHEAQQEIDALDAALDDPAQATRLAGDVIAHRKLVDMGECFQRQLAQGPLAHPHENPVAHFAEKDRAHPRQPVSHRQPHRAEQQECCRICRPFQRQRIHGPLVKIGRRHRDDLGHDQKRHRRQDPPLDPGFTLGPQIRADPLDGAPAIGGGFHQIGSGGSCGYSAHRGSLWGLHRLILADLCLNEHISTVRE